MKINPALDPFSWDCPGDRIGALPRIPRRRAECWGDSLRDRLDRACLEAGGTEGLASKDVIPFRRLEPVARPGWFRGRGAVATWPEFTARLAGAIRESATPGFPAGLGRAISGRAGRSVQFDSWMALERQGFNPWYLARTIRRIQAKAWVRWKVWLPLGVALRAISQDGVRRAIYTAVAMIATGRRWAFPPTWEQLPELIREARRRQTLAPVYDWARLYGECRTPDRVISIINNIDLARQVEFRGRPMTAGKAVVRAVTGYWRLPEDLADLLEAIRAQAPA